MYTSFLTPRVGLFCTPLELSLRVRTQKKQHSNLKKMSPALDIPRQSPIQIPNKVNLAYLQRSDEIRLIQGGVAAGDCISAFMTFMFSELGVIPPKFPFVLHTFQL